MPISEKIEDKRKDLVNFVVESFRCTKKNSNSLKTRLGCHRLGYGCEGTTFIQDKHFHSKIKSQHEPEKSEVKKKKSRKKMKALQVQFAQLWVRYKAVISL